MRRLLLLSTVFLLFAITGLYLGLHFNSIPNAFATGGAFTSTKHGGSTSVDNGAWCPLPPCGVNRARGGEVAVYFDDANAGTYQPGECAHCHETHSSFGGIEPPPTGSAAQPYLLFKANDNNFCWYCHEQMSLGMPPQPFGYGYWGFYQGQLNFTNSSHYKSSNFYWPGAGGTNAGVGTTADTVQIWPRKPRSSTGGNVGGCLNCHTPHGIANPSTPLDSGTPSNTNYVVGTTTAGAIIPRQLIAWEEALCLNCHDSTGPAATNVKTQVDQYLNNTANASGSGHPVRNSSYYSQHNLYNADSTKREANSSPPTSSGWLLGGKLHTECVDCHNPHVAQGRGTADPAPYYGNVFQRSGDAAFNSNRYLAGNDQTRVLIGKTNIGVWGVDVDTSTGSFIGVINNLSRTTPNYLYQLCMKCHSAWAWSGATGSDSSFASPTTSALKSWADGATINYITGGVSYNMTDIAAEFATNNRGYHPVFGVGKNRPELGVVKNPCWCDNDLNAANGSTYTCPPTTVAQTSYPDAGCVGGAIGTRTDLLGNDIQTLSQNFVPPWKHTSVITCVDCHEDETSTVAAGGWSPRGPHGSARPFILRKLDTSISYSRNGETTFNYTSLPTTGLTPNIFCLNCHRADIYGWSGGFPGGAGTYPDFARQAHHKITPHSRPWSDGNFTNFPPRGILCMSCHGGSLFNSGGTIVKALGNIHGSNEDVGRNPNLDDANSTQPNTPRGLRLMTGGAWRGWAKGIVGTTNAQYGACAKLDAAGTLNVCAHNNSAGVFQAGANYNY